MAEIALSVLLLSALILALSMAVLGARAVLVPSRPVTVTVGEGRRLDARTGETLLGVLQRAAIAIPSACAGAGTCGLCRVEIETGAPPPLPTEAGRLTRAELRAGARLACQVTLRGDMGLRLTTGAAEVESFDCVVETSRQLTPLIREVTLRRADGAAADLDAGAFVEVTAPPYRLAYADITVPDAFADRWTPLRHLAAGTDAPTTRAYSVASRPEDLAAGRLVLDIRLALPQPGMPGAPPGVVSSWLFARAAGDRVRVRGPFGSFAARPGVREMVFIGGGVGMAPLRAIIWDQLRRVGTDRPMSLWYGARNRDELLYADEMDALAEAHGNFAWTPVLSDPVPDDGWAGATGFVHNVLWASYLADHPAPEDCNYYLCGPPLMMRAVFAMLDDAGVRRERIFFDDFGV